MEHWVGGDESLQVHPVFWSKPEPAFFVEKVPEPKFEGGSGFSSSQNMFKKMKKYLTQNVF